MSDEFISKKELTDEEIAQSTGGQGQFTIGTVTQYCNISPDNTTFEGYYFGRLLNCPNYTYGGGDPFTAHSICSVCQHHSHS